MHSCSLKGNNEILNALIMEVFVAKIRNDHDIFIFNKNFRII